MKTLVVYYSAEGHTRRIAEMIAENLGADIFEVVPETRYTAEDLDWTNDDSRVTHEHDDEAKREMKLESTDVEGWEEYDRVIIGYPIWYGIAAWPINNFVKAMDFTGKTVLPFCTSHTSGLGDSDLLLKKDAKGGEWKEGFRFFQDALESKVKEWCEGLGV
ncbi:flavodoxin [Candidatus Saccharibacteria bacterium]|nr:flavodoxin [Candidatus Saccharibacteria bacterium]